MSNIDLAQVRYNWQVAPVSLIQQVLGFHLTQDELNVIGEKFGTKPGAVNSRYLLDPLQIGILDSLAGLSAIKHKKARGIELTENESRYVDKRGVSTQAGKGCGKTTIASMAALWFVIAYPYSKVFLVGPKYEQVKKALFAEIGKWIARSIEVYGDRSLIKKLLHVGADEIIYKDLDPAVLATKVWGAKILTFSSSSEEAKQKATSQGLHASNMLFIIDESPAVPENIFEVITGTCTEHNNLILSIFNPNKNTGWAIEAHSEKMKHFWITHQINSANSSLVTPESIKYKKERYGVDSNTYRVEVLGLPPLNDDGSFISYQWIRSSVDSYNDYEPEADSPLILSLDVGGGGDNSMVVVMHGRKIIEFIKNSNPSTEVVANWFQKLIVQWEPDEVYVDANAIGQGVYDKLRADGHKVKGLKMQMASNSEAYHRLRDELAYKLRDAFEEGSIYIPEDEELIHEITLMQEDKEHTSGKFKLLSKRNAKFRSEMRGKVGYESPNKLDALMQCFYRDYKVSLNIKRERNHGVNEDMDSRMNQLDEYAWMAY